MKTRIAAIAALLFPLAVLASGCGEDLTEKVQGVWKATGEEGRAMGLADGGFFEISKEKIRFDDDEKNEIDIVMEEKDGKLALRRAGTDRVAAVLSLTGDDTLEFTAEVPTFGGTQTVKVTLARSSKEELNAAYHPPVDKIVGIWRSETKSGVLEDSSFIEIAADSVAIDGSKANGTFTTQKGSYFFTREGSDRQEQYFFGKESGKLIRSRGMMSNNMYLVPSSAEEASSAAQAKRTIISRHLGSWGTGNKYLELGENSVDDNGETSAATPVYASGKVEWFRDGENSPFITTALLDGDRSLTVDGGGFSFRHDTYFKRPGGAGK